MPRLWFVYPLNWSGRRNPDVADRGQDSFFYSLFYDFEKGALPEQPASRHMVPARPTQFGLSGRQRYVANGSCTVGWLWSDQCRFLIFGKK